MSVVIPKQLSMFFSSDPADGAQNVSADGTKFSIALNNAINVPKGSVSCEVGIQSASIWNTSPNLSPDFNNNKFVFTTSNAAQPGTTTITFPEGLYSLTNFNTFLSSQFINLGLPNNLITLVADTSTQKTVLTFLEAGDQVDFTGAGTCREVLGFSSRLSPLTAQVAGFSDFSDNEAAFNRNNVYVIRGDVVNSGIPYNNRAANILSSVPITVRPGSQINYSPTNVLWSQANELIGNPRSNLSFELSNQALKPTPTAGDYWSFVLTIRYSVLLSNEALPLNPSGS